VRALGHERVLFIGSDAPSLTVSDLLAAHTALDTADVVLAPARDGGVTLMGSRLAWPDLAPCRGASRLSGRHWKSVAAAMPAA